MRADEVAVIVGGAFRDARAQGATDEQIATAVAGELFLFVHDFAPSPDKARQVIVKMYAENIEALLALREDARKPRNSFEVDQFLRERDVALDTLRQRVEVDAATVETELQKMSWLGRLKFWLVG